MAMERDYLQFDLQKPPLPFVGNKLRWWHELRPMIEALPRGARVFDAFAGQGEYIGADACRDAREFCAAAMTHARGSVWLWDEPDSDLVRIAIEHGATVHPFPGVRNRQEAREVMCEIRRITDDLEDLPLFAWAAKKGIAI